MTSAILAWMDRNILTLGREMRLSYLPPLMVYVAAGISGLTAIVGTFFVKDYLDLSAELLAALGFWVTIPWSLKVPMGHLVDLIWRWKSYLVFVGAALITISLLIMVGLLYDRVMMTTVMPAADWFVLSSLLAPIGYVIQDAVADAMTVEAVPRVDVQGMPVDPARLKLMHTTMQTLGRVAIIGGTVLVSLINIYIFSDAQSMAEEAMAAVYGQVYVMALAIPMISVAGVIFAACIKHHNVERMLEQGLKMADIETLLAGKSETTEPNWWILGGSLVFVVFTIAMGLSDSPYSQEIIFTGSLAIVLFLIARLTRVLAPEARRTLIGTAIIIFVFRAVPLPGPGMTWWMIDELGFDEQFFSLLSLIGSVLTLAGMFIFRRFMAEHSIAYVVAALTIASALLSLPYLGMYYGLHEWSAALTGGVVDARFIAVINTAFESPLGQIAMIPMLAWIASSAPANLKATFFAVMASFTNLALALSQLGTKYLNQVFLVTREVTEPVSGLVQVPADYSQFGDLMMTVILAGLVLPFVAILLVRLAGLRWA